MRRKDREITQFHEIVEVIKNCDVCTVALNDDGYPYIFPLNFGWEVVDGTIYLYFHSALDGHKVDLMKKDNRASFEMDCKHQLQYFEEKGYCTMAYESVIGRGHIRILDEDEKMEALKKIMGQYHKEMEAFFHPAAISRTLVYVLKVETITGKRNKPK